MLSTAELTLQSLLYLSCLSPGSNFPRWSYNIAKFNNSLARHSQKVEEPRKHAGLGHSRAVIFLPTGCLAGQSSELRVVIFHWTWCLCRCTSSKTFPAGDSRVWRGARAREKDRKCLTFVLPLDTFQEQAPGTPLPWMGINY